MRIIEGDAVAKFVGERVNSVICPPFVAIGTEIDGQIVNGTVFNVFEPPDVHVTVAGERFTKGYLSEIGAYAFGKLKCRRMTAITSQPKIVRIAERLGGQVEGCLRQHFPDGRDAFVIGILKSEYRF
jgi:hypothetical protein